MSAGSINVSGAYFFLLSLVVKKKPPDRRLEAEWPNGLSALASQSSGKGSSPGQGTAW